MNQASGERQDGRLMYEKGGKDQDDTDILLTVHVRIGGDLGQRPHPLHAVDNTSGGRDYDLTAVDKHKIQ